MRTLRITAIFAALALELSLAATLLYSALKPASSVLEMGSTPSDPILTLIPIACGLIVAPITLRLNRCVAWR